MDSVERALKDFDYSTCVTRCGRILESLLIDLLHLVKRKRALVERDLILDPDRFIGKNKKALSTKRLVNKLEKKYLNL